MRFTNATGGSGSPASRCASAASSRANWSNSLSRFCPSPSSRSRAARLGASWSGGSRGRSTSSLAWSLNWCVTGTSGCGRVCGGGRKGLAGGRGPGVPASDGGGRGGREEVQDQGSQRRDGRGAVAGVAQHDRHVRVQFEGGPHLLRVVAERAVELVHGDEEPDAPVLEEVDGLEALLQAAGVGEHHGAQRAGGQLVPQEPEAPLSRRAEQVQHDPVLVDRDPAEVERDGGGGLALHPSEVVDPDAGGGDELLGAERLDLARGADGRRLADAEAARDEDLDLGRERLRLVV